MAVTKPPSAALVFAIGLVLWLLDIGVGEFPSERYDCVLLLLFSFKQGLDEVLLLSISKDPPRAKEDEGSRYAAEEEERCCCCCC